MGGRDPLFHTAQSGELLSVRLHSQASVILPPSGRDTLETGELPILF